MLDIVIVGGGAAGLCAAIFAAQNAPGAQIALLEKAPRTGRKLLVTGNGTCNLSNRDSLPSHYHCAGGGDQEAAEFTKPALLAFPPEETIRFFSSIGLECQQRPDGRIYPTAESAAAVVDCLRLELQSRGVQEIVGCTVNALSRRESGFVLDTSRGMLESRRVLLCTGGAAAPAQGGSAQGYTLPAVLGHTRSPLFPSIVQVKTDPTFVKSVKGIRLTASVSFFLDGRLLTTHEGEILFADYGISGPAVMQISRCVGDWERTKRGQMLLKLDIVPACSREQVLHQLRKRRTLPGRTLENYLTGWLPKRLGQTLLRIADLYSPDRPVASLTDSEIDRLGLWLKSWPLEVEGTTGMGGAQVTAGGLTLAEFDAATLESRLCPGLYAAGETLDIDGDCGGFNLQWAWASAHLAARGITEGLI